MFPETAPIFLCVMIYRVFIQNMQNEKIRSKPRKKCFFHINFTFLVHNIKNLFDMYLFSTSVSKPYRRARISEHYAFRKRLVKSLNQKKKRKN